jgi:multiple sugar transport system substrate-binding protein
MTGRKASSMIAAQDMSHRSPSHRPPLGVRLRGGLSTAVALFVLLGAAAIAGCGGSRRRPVVFWEFWPKDVIQPVMDDFARAHPEISVEMQQLTWEDGPQKIAAAVASGTVPDLCELGSTKFAQYAAAGRLGDMTSLADSLRARYRAWDMVTYDGRVFGLPWIVGTRALFYNTDLFRRAGLDPAKPPQTWSELRNAAAAIQKLGGDVHGYGLNVEEREVLFKKFFPYAWGAGGSVLSADGTRSVVHSPENVAALKFYLSLKPYSLLERQKVLDQAFKQGRIGMNFSGPWLLQTIPKDAPNLHYNVALVPKPDAGGTHASFLGGEILVTFTKVKHPDAAMTLAKFLISPPEAAKLARATFFTPATVGAENDPYYVAHPVERVFVQQLATAQSPPAIPQWADIEEILNAAVGEALYGRLTAEAALARADEQITALLKAAVPNTTAAR